MMLGDNPWNASTESTKKKNNIIINENLCIKYINDYNNTIFIVLKNLDREVEEEFLKIMNPEKDVKIIFRKGSALLSELNAWENEIFTKLFQLEKNNVTLTSFGKTENGTISIAIKDISDEKIKTFLDIIDGKVPPGILCLSDGEIPILVYDQTDSYRPVLGGTSIWANGGTGTLGYYVTWNNGNNKGILSAAHVLNSTGYAVHQSSYPDFEKIGTAVQMCTWQKSDSALAEFDNGISGIREIWNQTSRPTVHSEMRTANMQWGEVVEMMGSTSGYLSGEILRIQTIHHYRGYNLQEQLVLNLQVQHGDSGAPVNKTGAYNLCTAYGVIWGRDEPPDGISYASAIDGIESDLGLDLNFADSTYPSWTDNFNDNTYNPALWSKLETLGGTAAESSGKLTLTVPSTGQSGQVLAGYWTRWHLDLNGGYVEVKIPEFNSLDEMILVISSDSTIGQDPYTYTDYWYRCLITRYTANDYDWYIQKKLGGNPFTVMFNHTTFTANEKLKIALDDGYIRFYEHDTLRYVEEYAIPETWHPANEVYVVVFTSTLRVRGSGTDYFDDFKYQTYDSPAWVDNFGDGSYSDKWDRLSGMASESGGTLQLSDNAQMKSKPTIGMDRYVSGWVKTNIAGSNHWEVAYLQAKYDDWDNQIYALIWPDGTVELGVRYQGYQNGWATASGSVLNATGTWHRWEFITSWDRVILEIDGDVKFDQTHANFAKIVGKVGLHPNSPSTASYDDIVVIDG